MKILTIIITLFSINSVFAQCLKSKAELEPIKDKVVGYDMLADTGNDVCNGGLKDLAADVGCEEDCKKASQNNNPVAVTEAGGDEGNLCSAERVIASKDGSGNVTIKRENVGSSKQ